MLSWYQPTATWFLRKSRVMLSTPRITLERPRVLIKTKKLLRHTREDTMVGVYGPQHHYSAHELQLGQKPKLGGRYADITLIYISYFVGSLYIHVSFSFDCSCFVLLSKTQKDQKYFCCFSLVISLVFCFWFSLPSS